MMMMSMMFSQMRVLQVFLSISIVLKNAECRCSPFSELTIVDANGQQTCKRCPKCSPGQGLPVQCGSRIASGTATNCTSCKANETFSERYDSSTCKSCNLCGLRNVIQHCTPQQNRICGNSCPPGHFLDEHGDCTRCYFCCENVPEHDRLKKCKDLGMPRSLQCSKTKRNKRCKAFFDQTSVKMSVTATPMITTVTVAIKHEPLTMTNTKGTIAPITSGNSSSRSHQLTTKASKSLTTSGKPTLHVEKDNLINMVVSVLVRVLGVSALVSVLVVTTVLFSKHKTAGFTEVKSDDIDISIIPEDVDLSDLPYDVEQSIWRLNTKCRGISDWYNVGRQLGVPVKDMKTVEMEYNHPTGNPARLLIEILYTKYCLKLQGFVTALQEVGRNDIAKEICDCYKKVEYLTTDRFNSRSTVVSYA